MQSIQPDMKPSLIHCREFPAFAADNLESVRLAFRGATPCSLRQAWLQKEETDFAPAMVRVGWRSESLLIFAELTDVDVYNQATSLNQRIWELGDTFEIFLRPVTQESYVEFHVSPNNQRLQLRFKDAGALDHVRKTGSIESVVVVGEAFRSTTWVRPETQQWFAYAEIPASSVSDRSGPLNGCQWSFSFSRYDYTRGRKEPVISSTSGHAQPNFHRQHEWGMMNFCRGPQMQAQ
ncbi:MAG: hypothetical protein JWR19_2497 [Pedosphaera sp.]|nr:hypothetical protein [Pedosphaera sp.]